ncbi:hypothetical protein GGR51DRAFT_352228 [Nemania sp. FL0031]|nr:hypothetical protein GGR51DRAFT_352228 [Nemania sp. FL0031]
MVGVIGLVLLLVAAIIPWNDIGSSLPFYSRLLGSPNTENIKNDRPTVITISTSAAKTPISNTVSRATSKAKPSISNIVSRATSKAKPPISTTRSAVSAAETPIIVVTNIDEDVTLCSFEDIKLYGAICSPAHDIASRINLERWRAVALRLSEIKRLLHRFRDEIVGRQGIKDLQRLHADLLDVVEKPLRKGCEALRHLETELVEFKNVNLEENEEQRKAVETLLHKVEKDLLKFILGASSRHQLPSWAREAPELQSQECPKQDCFRVGEATLESITFHIPHVLLNEVWRLEGNTMFEANDETESFTAKVYQRMQMPTWKEVRTRFDWLSYSRLRQFALELTWWQIGLSIGSLGVVGWIITYFYNIKISWKPRRPAVAGT